MIITIDGPSGAGKSSVSRAYAKKHTVRYINSGAFYRVIAHIVYTNGYNAEQHTTYTIQEAVLSLYTDTIIPSIDWNDNDIAVSIPTQMQTEIKDAISEAHKDIIPHHLLFNKQIDSMVSGIANIQAIRQSINTRIRTICSEGDWIIEGRDAGSNIFPNAPWKFYIDASIEERTRRRSAEYNIAESDTHDIVHKRDERDASYGNLQKIHDAIYIDTSPYTIEEIINTIYTIINNK